MTFSRQFAQPALVLGVMTDRLVDELEPIVEAQTIEGLVMGATE